MNDGNNKTPRKIEESSKSVVGSSSAVRPSGWKKLLSKRWVFPAAYMAAAAIIVAILWVYSGTDKDESKETVTDVTTEISNDATNAPPSSDAAPAAANTETLRWPVDKMEDMTTTMPFYDQAASLEEREAAMVEYNGTFTPHTAVDLARKDAKAFDVLAAMSGEVTVAEQTPGNNFEVEVKHAGGLVTVYQSLSNIEVKVGDQIEQGDKIGVAGQSQTEPGEGYHVHFEVRSNGESINPATKIPAAE